MKSEIMNLHAPNQEDHQAILIVEDERPISDLLVNILEQETPYWAFAVSDAAQAMEALNAIRPSLFILDYGLPGINGLKLHDLLHDIAGLESVPTLMISVFTPSLQARQERNITFLTKPFDLDLFLNVVRNLLSQQQG
jgi:DNA-binding response OmpR family regulator